MALSQINFFVEFFAIQNFLEKLDLRQCQNIGNQLFLKKFFKKTKLTRKIVIYRMVCISLLSKIFSLKKCQK
jgi:hypothetical protein